jgi:hypothetical protein
MTGPTREQLEAEPYWAREINTPELLDLERRLCIGRGRAVTTAGGKGDIRHLAGGHRSAEWLARSAYCTNRTYTAQIGLTAEQVRHIGAYDDIPGAWGSAANRAAVDAATKRLIAAARAGQLVGVTEILGTVDGNLVRFYVASKTFGSPPDSSHRDHNHLTFDRTQMRNAPLMVRIAGLLLGDEMEPSTPLSNGRTVNDTLVTTMGRLPTDLANVNPALKRLEDAVSKLALGGIDADALADRIAAKLGITPDAMREAVREGVRAEIDAATVTVELHGGGV